MRHFLTSVAWILALAYVGISGTDRKAVIQYADMSEPMQQDAVDVATQALENFSDEEEIADYIEEQFVFKFGPTWHCFVGSNVIGVPIPDHPKHIIDFYMGQVEILLFKLE